MRTCTAAIVTLLPIFPTALAGDAAPAGAPPAPPRAAVVFLETNDPAESPIPPLCRRVTDPDRLGTYASWLDNESAARALELLSLAQRLAASSHGGDAAGDDDASLELTDGALHVILVEGGNHPGLGFRLETPDGFDVYPRALCIKLAPRLDSFGTTLLHETGHIVLALLGGGYDRPRRDLASIPHSTAALSDRWTAFNEGFAIHLETLAAHLGTARELRERYRHERFDFGPGDTPADARRGEYLRPAADLLSYAQSIARYHEVRENTFAFAPAYRGPTCSVGPLCPTAGAGRGATTVPTEARRCAPGSDADYLRVQLERTRDFAALRSANQLLQCEGFCASFFFGCLLRGGPTPNADILLARTERIFTALRDTLRQPEPGAQRRASALTADTAVPPGSSAADTPYLLRFVETYLRLYPDEGPEIVDVLLDLSHGVFVDPDAPAIWRETYLAALAIDKPRLNLERLHAARLRWRAAVLADPQVLYSRLGPQLRCTVPAVTINLAVFSRSRPLTFDLNTAEHGVLALIPGITPAEIERWETERATRPFAASGDFRERVALSADVLAGLRFEGD